MPECPVCEGRGYIQQNMITKNCPSCRGVPQDAMQSTEIPAAEDFVTIARALKEIEEEKRKERERRIDGDRDL